MSQDEWSEIRLIGALHMISRLFGKSIGKAAAWVAQQEI
jgi:hypothetical protein